MKPSFTSIQAKLSEMKLNLVGKAFSGIKLFPEFIEESLLSTIRIQKIVFA